MSHVLTSWSNSTSTFLSKSLTRCCNCRLLHSPGVVQVVFVVVVNTVVVFVVVINIVVVFVVVFVVAVNTVVVFVVVNNNFVPVLLLLLLLLLAIGSAHIP